MLPWVVTRFRSPGGDGGPRPGSLTRWMRTLGPCPSGRYDFTEQAASAARRGSDALPVQWEALARLLLRAEGVASSFLEGLTSPLAEVVAAELDPTVGETARWVADNLAAVSSAIEEAHDRPLTVEALHRWHRVLMRGARHLPGHLVGSWRDAQGWIGGTSPLDAALVPTPPRTSHRSWTTWSVSPIATMSTRSPRQRWSMHSSR